MPLLALADGQRTVSSLLSDEEWGDLQKAVRAKSVTVTLPCGQPGHPKTRHGTRFFTHNPGAGHECESAAETAQHLRAKDIIVKAAVAAGWHAEPEVRGDGWVADVLAHNDKGHKVAFEVQWSAQGDADFARRQERYAAAGVRCAWFVRHEHSVPAVPSRELPIFLLAQEGDNMTGRLGDESGSLADAVTALLQGRVKDREYVSNGEPAASTVLLHRHPCWKCHCTFFIWQVAGSSVTGNCGLIHFEEHSFALFAQTRPEASPSVLKAVAQAAVGQTLPMAEMSKKFTKTSGTTYMAFSCPECHAVSGDMYVRNLILEAGYAEPYRSITVEAGQRGLHRPHWCVEGDNGFCAQPPPGYQPPLHSGDSENESSVTVQSAVNVQLVGQNFSIRDAMRTMFGSRY